MKDDTISDLGDIARDTEEVLQNILEAVRALKPAPEDENDLRAQVEMWIEQKEYWKDRYGRAEASMKALSDKIDLLRAENAELNPAPMPTWLSNLEPIGPGTTNVAAVDPPMPYSVRTRLAEAEAENAVAREQMAELKRFRDREEKVIELANIVYGSASVWQNERVRQLAIDVRDAFQV